jgi:hypothetical protein
MNRRISVLFLMVAVFLGSALSARATGLDGASVARERFLALPADLIPVTGDARAKLVTRENAEEMFLAFRLDADTWGELKVYINFDEQKLCAVTVNTRRDGKYSGKLRVFEWSDGKWVDTTAKALPPFDPAKATNGLVYRIPETEPVIEYLTGPTTPDGKTGARVHWLGFDGEKFFVQQ